jgi:hypothetical protein
MSREDTIELLRESYIYERFQLSAMIGKADPLPCSVFFHSDPDVLQLVRRSRRRNKRNSNKAKAATTTASGPSSSLHQVQGLRRSQRKTAPKNLLVNAEAEDQNKDQKLSYLPIVRVVPLSKNILKPLTSKYFVTRSPGQKEKRKRKRDSRDVDSDGSVAVQPRKK